MTHAQELEFKAGYWASRLQLVERLLSGTTDLDRARRLEQEGRRAERWASFYAAAVGASRAGAAVIQFDEAVKAARARVAAVAGRQEEPVGEGRKRASEGL